MVNANTCHHEPEIMWIEQESNQIAIIKHKSYYDRAVDFCESICGMLFEPTNFDAVYDGLSKVSRHFGFGDLIIGAKAKKTEDGDVKFFYLSNSSQIITKESSEFIDKELEALIYVTKEVGEIPILLDTNSNSRYNLWTFDLEPDRHFFVCQKGMSEEGINLDRISENTFLRNKMFMLDEMAYQNTPKFVILLDRFSFRQYL